MSQIEVDTILPQSSSTLQLGNAGSTINVTGTLDGSGLTGLNADNISSGTVADARLSSNVTLLGQSPTYSSISPTAIEPNTASNINILGTGFTDIKENKLWYKEGVVFNETGEYKINIQHAMRENGKINGVINLEGITDIGFRVETPLIN